MKTETVRQAVSDIINDLKSTNIDDKYSFRFLASKLYNKIDFFLKQDSADRNILLLTELWKPLKKIKLEEAAYINNEFYYDYCLILKKSKFKIPKVFQTKYGNLIKILNILNSIEYKQIKPFEYKEIKNREFVDKRIKYFWIEDDYLYIPDSDVEEVRGYGLFKNTKEVDLLNGNENCCYKILDSEILVPDYILALAKQEVIKELRQINKTIKEDQNPNLNNAE